jgi:transposase
MSRTKGLRSDGPRPRRSFTPAQKLDLLTRYEQAVAAGEGGAFLRREGLYSSLMSMASGPRRGSAGGQGIG